MADDGLRLPSPFIVYLISSHLFPVLSCPVLSLLTPTHHTPPTPPRVGRKTVPHTAGLIQTHNINDTMVHERYGPIQRGAGEGGAEGDGGGAFLSTRRCGS